VVSHAAEPVVFAVTHALVVLTVALSLTPGAWAKPKYKVLAVIPGGLWSGLTFDNKGNLFGATTGGGDYSEGSIFEMTPDAKGKWTVTTLYSFNSKTDGEAPNGDLIFDAAGNLYGTTPVGGTYDRGTIFELSSGSTGWTFTVLYAFCEQYSCPDGGGTSAGLVPDKDGNLLGTAGSGLYGMGVVFELTSGSSGWTYNVLYSFGSRPHDASGPYDPPTVGKSGDLYGTTRNGGLYGAGTVFRLRHGSDGGKDQLPYSFCRGGSPCPDGMWPLDGVVLDGSGNVYGTTTRGGNACYGGCGTVFKLTRDPHGRWAHSVLYGFLKPRDGFEPATAIVFDKAGNLYGTTGTGGTGSCFDGCGVVYELSPGPHGEWKYKVLYEFPNPSESPPDGRLVLDSKGNLYGTAFSVVYEITP